MDTNARPSASLQDYLQLMRLDRPVGTLLLLWPTLAALAMAADGIPPTILIVIFTLGTFLMRSAGCVINDYADRNVDGAVKRTKDRPLVTGAISKKQALGLFALLVGSAGLLILFLNRQTQLLAVAGLALAMAYPFMKRYTHLPQLFLGLAFSWAIPMAYSAQGGDLLDPKLWMLFVANCFWTIAYDTYYAMTDRPDDLKVGIKSTAILFGKYDLLVILCLQGLTLSLLVWIGILAHLNWIYFVSLIISLGLFGLQYQKAKERDRQACFHAFLDNNRIGYCIFIGIAASLLFM